LLIGRFIGLMAYYFDFKHKSQAYANLKMAFAEKMSPKELKKITKSLFMNYGQNLIELFYLPKLTEEKFEEMVDIQGKEHVSQSLSKGKGTILLAMHYGSWELASLSCAMLGHPYKVIVKPQKKYSKLDELLNNFRECNGSVIISRGLGTRGFIKSLRNNEIIGMVVDQGGRDGVLVPFFDRQASMSVGAIRMGLKLGVPICFAIIIRIKGRKHKMIIHQPLVLKNTNNLEEDIISNLKQIVLLMEKYIYEYPHEYMWFYKIWKYSKQANIVILSDCKVGHLRQSQSVANAIQQALINRGVESKVNMVEVKFKNPFLARVFSVFSFVLSSFVLQGRLELLKWFIRKDSFQKLIALKGDFFVSCGSSIAGLNNLLAKDYNAKSIAVLKPGMLRYRKFDFIVLPQHDAPKKKAKNFRLTLTEAAPNLINDKYLDEQKNMLLNRYSHLKTRTRYTIGVLIGGDTKHVYLSEKQILMFAHQLKQITKQSKVDLLITTSRRTPPRIEQLLFKEFKKDPSCPLLILSNNEDVPEALGGILALSDLLVVSGDSLSMVSEAASSGKKTIVFLPTRKDLILNRGQKYKNFIDRMHNKGFIYSTTVNSMAQTIYDVMKNKIYTKRLDDNQTILNAVQDII